MFASSGEAKACDSWKHYFLTTEKLRDFYCRWLKAAAVFFILASFLLVFYSAVPAQFQWYCLKCPPTVSESSELEIWTGIETGSGDRIATNISHIMFGIGGSVRTWRNRRRYSELWWKPGVTRGFVWLDERPPANETWPENSPPYRVSEDASRFKYTCWYGSRSAVRMSRIVSESVRLGLENVRWFVMGDDDTVFITENLVSVLGKYNHEEYWYVGGVSESVEQAVTHSYGMAYGGGGFAISSGLAKEVARLLDGCLDRYASFYGSDQRVHACLTEIGVPLTREPGFHQVDLRGSAYGLLAAHPIAPLISLHHLDSVDPIIPGRTQQEGMRDLMGASRVDPGRTLQQSFCYDIQRNWSVSVSWGYTAQIYPWILTAKELGTPLRTFRTWRTYHDDPFTFNTRPWRPEVCQQPLLYFFDGLDELGPGGTRSFYSRHRNEPSKECNKPEFAVPLKVDRITVFAPKLSPLVWSKAPRRQCCDMRRKSGGNGGVEVSIRQCHLGESLSPR